MELGVVAEAELHAGGLEIVANHDFLFYERHNLIFLEAQEVLFFHIKGLAQGVQLGAHGILQAVAGELLAHQVEVGLGTGTIVELLAFGEGYKVLVISIRQAEVSGDGDGFVTSHILQGVLLHHAVHHQRISQPAVVVGLDLYVGSYAAAVAYDTPSGRLEFMGERVGNMPHAAVLVAVGVVDSLHAAAAGRVVFGGGELELAAVWQRAYALHQALSEGAGADDYGAVQVLQGAGNDFRGRCRARIHHDDERQLGIERGLGGAACVGRAVFPAFGCDHKRPLGHEDGNYVHGLVEKSAAVAPEVKHQGVKLRGLLESRHGGTHLVCHPLGEAGLEDISGVGSHHSGVLDVGKMYRLAGDAHVDHIAGIYFLDFEKHLGAGSASHLLAAFGTVEPLYALAVDGHDFVAATQAGLVGRGVLVGFVDNHIPLDIRFVDNRAYTSIGFLYHHPEVLVFLFGDVCGIGIEVGEHGVHAGALYAVERKRIHIRTVEFLEYGAVNLGPLAEFEAFGLRPGGKDRGKERYCDKNSLHKCKINNYSLSCNHRAMARSALPRWEMVFLVPSGSSATLLPGYSLAMNTGS